MKVLITGASSGIGRDMAKEFAERKYDLVVVARDEKRLNELKTELDSKVYITNKNYIVDLKVITDSLGYIMDYNTENDTLTIIDKK